MKKSLLAFAVAATASATNISPAAATAFPSLTTIYVGTGVLDSSPNNVTAFNCSNVSGVTVSVRFLVLNDIGAAVGNKTESLAHGTTKTVSTNSSSSLAEAADLDTGFVNQGVVNIESTNSAVFCNAIILEQGLAFVSGVSLPLVRVNPHPGTVE